LESASLEHLAGLKGTYQAGSQPKLHLLAGRLFLLNPGIPEPLRGRGKGRIIHLQAYTTGGDERKHLAILHVYNRRWQGANSRLHFIGEVRNKFSSLGEK